MGTDRQRRARMNRASKTGWCRLSVRRGRRGAWPRRSASVSHRGGLVARAHPRIGVGGDCRRKSRVVSLLALAERLRALPRGSGPWPNRAVLSSRGNCCQQGVVRIGLAGKRRVVAETHCLGVERVRGGQHILARSSGVADDEAAASCRSPPLGIAQLQPAKRAGSTPRAARLRVRWPPRRRPAQLRIQLSAASENLRLLASAWASVRTS